MPRAARVVAEGVPHPITQRGNKRQDTFPIDEGRRIYLQTLRAKCRQHGRGGARLLPADEPHPFGGHAAAPRCFGASARRSALDLGGYVNRRYGRSGHLWQNRFYSCPLGAGQVVAALVYVDLNPLRAGLAGAAEQYPWSSARKHLGGPDAADLVDDRSWGELGLDAEWRQRLATAAGGGQEQQLHRCTYAGTPCGPEAFVAEMEQRTGRRLHPKPPGPEPGYKRGFAAAG